MRSTILREIHEAKTHIDPIEAFTKAHTQRIEDKTRRELMLFAQRALQHKTVYAERLMVEERSDKALKAAGECRAASTMPSQMTSSHMRMHVCVAHDRSLSMVPRLFPARSQVDGRSKWSTSWPNGSDGDATNVRVKRRRLLRHGWHGSRRRRPGGGRRS